MAYYREQLPQLGNEIFITDGGLETVLLFQQGWDLPDFAAFTLLDRPLGTEALQNYFGTYGELAKIYGMGIVLESPTWRASSDWGKRLGYDASALAEINRRAIALLQDIRDTYATSRSPMVISGCIGPRGDGYRPNSRMTATAAQQYHQAQVNAFRDTEADLLTAATITYPEEAIGIVRAAQNVQMPVVISFTVETDGHLPTGMDLRDAIRMVDAATHRAPAYYMINCAHPIHFDRTILNQGAWAERIRGIRANASMMSHAELDEADTLDAGNPQDLAERFYRLKQQLPQLSVLGGCCGTDHHHIEAICQAFDPNLVKTIPQVRQRANMVDQ